MATRRARIQVRPNTGPRVNRDSDPAAKTPRPSAAGNSQRALTDKDGKVQKVVSSNTSQQQTPTVEEIQRTDEKVVDSGNDLLQSDGNESKSAEVNLTERQEKPEESADSSKNDTGSSNKAGATSSSGVEAQAVVACDSLNNNSTEDPRSENVEKLGSDSEKANNSAVEVEESVVDNVSSTSERQVKAAADEQSLRQVSQKQTCPQKGVRPIRNVDGKQQTDVTASRSAAAEIIGSPQKPSLPPLTRARIPRAQPNLKDAGRRHLSRGPPLTPTKGSGSGVVEDKTERQQSVVEPPPTSAQAQVEPEADEQKTSNEKVSEAEEPPGVSKTVFASVLPPPATTTRVDKRSSMKKGEYQELMAQKRRRYRSRKGPPDRSAMTMLDFIYYNPPSNPMKEKPSNMKVLETVNGLHPSVEEEKVDNPDSGKEEENPKEEEEENIPGPRVRVGPNGEITLDEESLVIQKTKAVKDSISETVVFENVSETNYSSFRKPKGKKSWSDRETAKFYKALSACGTDFTLMSHFFPARTRQDLKNKFKREERLNRTLVDKAINDPTQFDMTGLEDDPSSSEQESQSVEEPRPGEIRHSTRRGRGQKRHYPDEDFYTVRKKGRGDGPAAASITPAISGGTTCAGRGQVTRGRGRGRGGGVGRKRREKSPVTSESEQDEEITKLLESEENEDARPRKRRYKKANVYTEQVVEEDTVAEHVIMLDQEAESNLTAEAGGIVYSDTNDLPPPPGESNTPDSNSALVEYTTPKNGGGSPFSIPLPPGLSPGQLVFYASRTPQQEQVVHVFVVSPNPPGEKSEAASSPVPSSSSAQKLPSSELLQRLSSPALSTQRASPQEAITPKTPQLQTPERFESPSSSQQSRSNLSPALFRTPDNQYTYIRLPSLNLKSPPSHSPISPSPNRMGAGVRHLASNNLAGAFPEATTSSGLGKGKVGTDSEIVASPASSPDSNCVKSISATPSSSSKIGARVIAASTSSPDETNSSVKVIVSSSSNTVGVNTKVVTSSSPLNATPAQNQVRNLSMLKPVIVSQSGGSSPVHRFTVRPPSLPISKTCVQRIVVTKSSNSQESCQTSSGPSPIRRLVIPKLITDGNRTQNAQERPNNPSPIKRLVIPKIPSNSSRPTYIRVIHPNANSQKVDFIRVTTTPSLGGLVSNPSTTQPKNLPEVNCVNSAQSVTSAVVTQEVTDGK